MQVNILCAVRDWRMAQELGTELGDGERCVFRVVTDGLSAVESCRRHAPDILVVDAVLPGMDGPGVVDSLRRMLEGRMPRVIGGSMLRFADEALRRHGVDALLGLPWKKEELRGALLEQMEQMYGGVDWEAAEAEAQRAKALLSQMGMNSALKGYAYLAFAAALVHESEARMEAVGRRVYSPIAERFSTTPQCVERLIRHAVERTMDAERAKGVYQFFGNTIDPTRGKPTNAQYICALAQRLRMQ